VVVAVVMWAAIGAGIDSTMITCAVGAVGSGANGRGGGGSSVSSAVIL